MSINAVVDLSHHNRVTSFDDAQSDGILGVIHKATQGTRGIDQQYSFQREAALNTGLLWGAYHFGTGSDGVMQAQHFLQVVNPDADTLLVLDFESNPQGPSMSLEEARSFVTHIYEETGQYPGFYSGHYVKELLGVAKDPLLAQCWFWLAQYGPTAVVPPTWPLWTMWQYTDGSLGPEPHQVAGIGRCDRDKFNGDEEGLRRLWGAV